MTDCRWPTSDALLSEGRAQFNHHAAAADATRARFGPTVFVRAVVEVSNFCRENCHYCGMRRDNRSLTRFRAQFESLSELLLHQLPEWITDINFQAGEDPVATRELVLPLVRLLRQETDLGISVCLGTLSQTLTRELHDAGASLYIIKFETADSEQYRRLEAPGTLVEREEHIRWLASERWKVSSGFIAGLPGDTVASALQNLRFASSLPLAGCSVSPFIPGEATPLAGAPAASLDLTLNCMAALRRFRPDWIIPAVSALNLTGAHDGYRRGLRTGANLCTVNLTPEVVRGDYLLYKRDRFIMNAERILTAIESEGLEPSTQSLAQFLGAEPAPAHA